MNTVITYLKHNWKRLNLNRFGEPQELSAIVLTPGFKASSHLIVFVLKAGYTTPILVIKLPRLSGDHGRLDKEVENLHKLHGMRQGGFDSMPEIVAYEDCGKHRLLVETMVRGEVMRRAMVKRQPENCILAALNWLDEISSVSMVSSQNKKGWFERLVENSFTVLESSFPLSETEKKLVARSREIVAPLREATIPLVFEHGDFSAPNILIDQKKQLGVVDWELAEPLGIPTADLFFFLSYVAFSREGAEKLNNYIAAFHNAFFKPKGRTKPYVFHYCEMLNLSRDLLKPLFVLSWSRYLATMLARLKGSEAAGDMLSDDSVKWLRTNRYYHIWQHSVENVKNLSF
jgi:aminoglycoside phosphotransferase (APT) family kinase protein